MFNQNQGIQQLLAAEKKASEKVTEARKRKAIKLKQAKDQAGEEVEKFRLERQKQFKQFEAQHLSSKEGTANKIDDEIDAMIKEMNRDVKSRKDPVIKDILKYVYNIQPIIHKNYRKPKH